LLHYQVKRERTPVELKKRKPLNPVYQGSWRSSLRGFHSNPKPLAAGRKKKKGRQKAPWCLEKKLGKEKRARGREKKARRTSEGEGKKEKKKRKILSL